MKIMGDQKGFSTNIKVYAAVVTLLSCCSPASSFLFPRVTRTSDATIIDCIYIKNLVSYYS